MITIELPDGEVMELSEKHSTMLEEFANEHGLTLECALEHAILLGAELMP
jgi:hypothetical protein